MPEITIKIYSPTLGDIEIASSETGFLDEEVERQQIAKLLDSATQKMRKVYGIEPVVSRG